MSHLSDRTVQHLREVADWPELTGSRYEVIEPLGRGGMGTVYRARDLLLERDVAIKVLGAHLAGAEGAERLRREASILAALEHPGIVPVYDVGVLADGRVYYAMKLVRGSRLDAHLTPGRPLPERLRVFQRICEAVAFAHAHGVIHRDLKPANVMIGPFGEVLVLDWGVAKLRGREEPESQHQSAGLLTGQDTAVGTVLGTPGFMAPEQAAGRTDLVDERTDVFALGALLRSLLEGLRDQPAPVRAIARKAMAPASSERYAGVAGMAEDVGHFLDGQPVGAYPEGPLERARRVFAKYQTAILLVTAYLLMRVLFILFRPE